MEQAISVRCVPNGEKPSHRFNRLSLLRGVFILLVGLVIMMMGAMAVARYSPIPPSPFQAYAEVFPGQSAHDIVKLGFTCIASEDLDYLRFRLAEKRCTLSLANSPFSHGIVIIGGDDIRHVSFLLRTNALRVGDLMLFWGVPEVQENSRSVYLYWRSRGIVAIASRNRGKYILFYPVWRVHISDAKSGDYP